MPAEMFGVAQGVDRMAGVTDALAVVRAHGAETEMRWTYLFGDREHDDEYPVPVGEIRQAAVNRRWQRQLATVRTRVPFVRVHETFAS